MNCEELLSLEQKDEMSLADNITTFVDDPAKLERRRERLAAIAIGGQSRQYFGKSVTAEDIDHMKAQEINFTCVMKLDLEQV